MRTLGIHVFRRDLRLEDNTALNILAGMVDTILPVFIFDDRQVTAHDYLSSPGLQMMCESLVDLDSNLRLKGATLHVRSGIAEDVIQKLIKEYSPIVLSYNKDYTPFSLKRDKVIDSVCTTSGTRVISEHDVTLFPPGSVLTKEGKPYSVYTHYRIATNALTKPAPVRFSKDIEFVERSGGGVLSEKVRYLVKEPKDLRVKGGRTAAKEMLQKLDDNRDYKEKRDFPSLSSTSFLSAHIKFGTLSIREVYHYARLHMPHPDHFLQEVLWHDFFTTVAALSPHVYEGAYKTEFNSLRWNDDTKAFARWKEGKTGFPIVDAGMRELLATGYMHNRVRMIVASFLIKDLHINWQWGEKYFAQTLTDYDPAVNNGNWQWVAGTGCDASPWFRIFNPWLQQEKFDAECLYIKKWIPELADLTPKEIHDTKEGARISTGYSAPMCDHKTQAQKTKEIFGLLKKPDMLGR